MSSLCRTIVTVERDGAVKISCERCDYQVQIPKAEVALPLGDCMTGMALLRVIFHVEHIENGVPEELLRA